MDWRWTDSLGVALMGHGIASRVGECARAAERAGLGSVWVIEDYFQPGAFTLAGAAAAVTERITIGIGVVNPYTRHPAVLAMETALLAGERVTSTGTCFSVRDVALEAPPPSPVPIVLGVKAPRALALAAEVSAG